MAKTRALQPTMQDLAVYDDSLAQAGRLANEVSAHNVFQTYHAKLRPNTERRQQTDLACFSEYLGKVSEELKQPGIKREAEALRTDPQAWRGMTYGMLQGFVRWQLQEGYAVGTVNVRLATIRQYCKLVGPRPQGAGVLSRSVVRDILTVKGFNEKETLTLNESREKEKQRKGKKKAEHTELSVSQVHKLKSLTLKSKRPHDALLPMRDALMVGLFSEHAFRCSELAALKIEDINLERNTVRVLRKKTDTDHDTHTMKKYTGVAALNYLKTLKEDGITSGPLFFGYKGNPIAARTINDRMATLGRALGIEGKRLSPHDLRHFWAFDAFQNGTPIDKVMAGAGWKTPAMALRYAKRSGIANEGVKLSGDD